MFALFQDLFLSWGQMYFFCENKCAKYLPFWIGATVAVLGAFLYLRKHNEAHT